MTVHLTLIGKPDCHLCDDARAIVIGVMNDINADAPAQAVTLEERSILDEPALFDRYVEDIPVLMIDGNVHTYWRVNPQRLRTALGAIDAKN